MLTQDFHTNRPLPGDNFRIVKGMDEGQLLRLFQFQRVRVGFVIGVAGQHHFTTTVAYRLDLDCRRRRRHDDDCPAADLGRRQRHTLRVIARRGADHATF